MSSALKTDIGVYFKEMFMDLASLYLGFSLFVHEQAFFLGGFILFFGLFFFPRRLVFLYSSVVTLVLGFIFKMIFKLPRPCTDLQSLVSCPIDFGFPSLHAGLAAILIMGSLGSRWAVMAFPLAVAVAVSRVYLGVHTMEQIIAGFALGVVVYLMVWMRWRNAP